MKLGIGIVLLSIGFCLGIGFNELSKYLFPNSTIILKATYDFEADNKIFIPKGTELTLDKEMPEGYMQTCLTIAVEGAALEGFQRLEKQRENYIVQYFVSKPIKLKQSL